MACHLTSCCAAFGWMVRRAAHACMHACAAYTYGKGIQGDVTLVHPHVSNHLRPGQARCAHGQGHAQRYASTATPPATRRRQHPTQGCEATF